MADKNTQLYASLSDVAALTHEDDIVTMVDEWSFNHIKEQCPTNKNLTTKNS